MNGTGRLVSAAGYEATAVHDEKVWNIMGSVVLVNDGALRIIPHAAGSHEVCGGTGIFDRQCPCTAGACSLEQLQRPVTEEDQQGQHRVNRASLACYLHKHDCVVYFELMLPREFKHPTPTIKWKAYDGGMNGWAFTLGDDVFIPVPNKTYNVGSYVYAEFTKTLKYPTRLTFGAYNFTANVVSAGDKAGGQFGGEQPVGKRVTFAVDWFTGKRATGYFTPGAAIKLSSKLTAYTAYGVGNSGASNGNHLLLVEIGWNLN